MCVACVRVSASTQGVQKRASDAQGLELWAVPTHSRWVLRTELRFSRHEQWVLPTADSSLQPTRHLFFMYMTLSSLSVNLCTRLHLLLFRSGKRGMGGTLLKVTQGKDLQLRCKPTLWRELLQVFSDPQNSLLSLCAMMWKLEPAKVWNVWF